MRFVFQPIKPEFVIANRHRYCKLCGCSSVIVGKHPKNENRSRKWNKIVWLIDLLAIFDTVVWLDYDAFVLTPDCSLFSKAYDFNIAVDAHVQTKYNSGVLVTKKSAVPFLDRVWNHSDFGRGVSDQNSINYLLPNYRFGVLDPKYNYFGPPPNACPGYEKPYTLSKNQTSVVIRHRAGQFKGSRTMDGKVVKCAYDQINLQEEAYRIWGFHTKKRYVPRHHNSVAVLTVIV